MGRPSITLFVDTVSPFAYEAYYILRNDAPFKACDITYIPIFLGGLMKACGNTPPIQVKNKDKWIMTERVRWARAFSVPMREEHPSGFPPLTLTTMRALCALSNMDGNDQSRLIRALDILFSEFWVNHRPTHQPEVLTAVLQAVLGEADVAKVMAQVGTTGKRILAENTDRAFAAGAFGLPWMICTNGNDGRSEGFWGVDHLGQVIEFLNLPRPKDGGWKALL